MTDPAATANDAAAGLRVAGWERWLLRGELGALADERAPLPGETGRRGRSARDWIVDAAMFAYAVLSVVATVLRDHTEVGTAWLTIDATLGAVACLALWDRRRHPLGVAWLCAGCSALSSAAVHAGLVAIFSAAIHARPRRALIAAGATIAAAALDCAIYPGAHRHTGYDGGFLLLWTATTIAAFALGSFVRVRRELVVALRERAHQLALEQRTRVREARLAERTRIAREMHDVLAHRISLLNVHAGALEINPHAAPDQIAQAATVIRTSARAAHDELREIIGVLRADPTAERPEPPQPTLADLPALLEESRRAGIDLAFHDGLTGPVPRRTGRTVYRVMQEALTNARKHAPGQTVQATLTGDRGGTLRLEVVNRPSPSRDPAASHEPALGTGTGLIGLAERIGLSGGELTHGPLPAGGFRLVARIPWPCESDDAAPAP